MLDGAVLLCIYRVPVLQNRTICSQVEEDHAIGSSVMRTRQIDRNFGNRELLTRVSRSE